MVEHRPDGEEINPSSYANPAPGEGEPLAPMELPPEEPLDVEMPPEDMTAFEMPPDDLQAFQIPEDLTAFEAPPDGLRAPEEAMPVGEMPLPAHSQPTPEEPLPVEMPPEEPQLEMPPEEPQLEMPPEEPQLEMPPEDFVDFEMPPQEEPLPPAEPAESFPAPPVESNPSPAVVAPPEPVADLRAASLEEVVAKIDAKFVAYPKAQTAVGARAGLSVAYGVGEDVSRLILFALSDTLCAFPMDCVTEMGRTPQVTPVPRVPSWLRGVTNVRGDIFSVVDLKELIGFPEGVQSSSGRMMILKAKSSDVSACVLVDRVDGLIRVQRSSILPPAAPLQGALAPYVVGICEHQEQTVSVLDVEKFLSSAEMQQFES